MYEIDPWQLWLVFSWCNRVHKRALEKSQRELDSNLVKLLTLKNCREKKLQRVNYFNADAVKVGSKTTPNSIN